MCRAQFVILIYIEEKSIENWHNYHSARIVNSEMFAAVLLAYFIGFYKHTLTCY